jgi:hypothetical protein
MRKPVDYIRRRGTGYQVIVPAGVFARRGRRGLKDQATRDHHAHDAGIAGDDREPRQRASKALARRCHVQVLQSLLRLEVPLISACPKGTMKAKSLNQVVVAVLVQELLDPGRPPTDSQEDSSEP